MSITYLDTDTREVIAVIDDLAPALYEGVAERFAANLGATIERMVPTQFENEWIVELKIPCEVRQAHMPLSGDKVVFTAMIGYYPQEVGGIFQFKRGLSYVICDDYGGEWELSSMWQMRKIWM